MFNIDEKNVCYYINCFLNMEQNETFLIVNCKNETKTKISTSSYTERYDIILNAEISLLKRITYIRIKIRFLCSIQDSCLVMI